MAFRLGYATQLAELTAFSSKAQFFCASILGHQKRPFRRMHQVAIIKHKKHLQVVFPTATTQTDLAILMSMGQKENPTRAIGFNLFFLLPISFFFGGYPVFFTQSIKQIGNPKKPPRKAGEKPRETQSL